MSTQFSFDATQVAPDAGREVLSPGWYNAAVTETEIKPTKAGDGSFLLSAQLTILDGYAQGRIVFVNFNIRNKNPTAEKIGLAQLSSLMHAMNYLTIQQHTGELHGKPFKMKLKVKLATYKKDAQGVPTKEVEYDESNEVVAYKPTTEQVEMATAQSGSIGSTPPAGFGAAPVAPIAGSAGTAAPAAPVAAAAPAVAANVPAATTQPWNRVPAAAAAPVAAAPIAEAPAVAAIPAVGGTMPPWMQPQQ